MPKTLIISDIHHRTSAVDSILESVDYDKVVFLGDYFDDFDDTPATAKATAEWLDYQIKNIPDAVWLIGNHDVPYVFPYSPWLFCCGYTSEKSKVIKSTLSLGCIEKMHFYHNEQDWHLTHAGIAEKFLHPIHAPTARYFKAVSDSVKQDTFIGVYNDVLGAGWAGCGRETVGGWTWLDWNQEFVPIPGVNQIVGHTTMQTPQAEHGENSKNYCIDTFNKHYGIIENGEFAIYTNKHDRLTITS